LAVMALVVSLFLIVARQVESNFEFTMPDYALISFILVAAVLLISLKRGVYLSALRYVPVLVAWAGMAILTWQGSGVFDIGMFGFLPVVFMAAILVDRKAAVAVGALSVAYFFFVALMTVRGIHPALPYPPLAMARDYAGVTALCVSLVVMYERVVQGSIETIAELSAQKEADRERMSKAELGYREIYDATADAILVHDARTSAIRDCNQAAVSLFGFPREELLLRDATDFDSSFDGVQSGKERLLAKDREGAGTVILERLMRRADGSSFWAEIRLARSVVAGEERVISVVRDVSERNAAERAIDELNHELERRVEERTTQLAAANTELLATNEDLRCALSELRATQDQLVMSEKLAALGQLAAGIAHEINSPLGAMSASNRLIQTFTEGRWLELAERIGRLGSESRADFDHVSSLVSISADSPPSDRPARKSLASALSARGMPRPEETAELLCELGLADRVEELESFLRTSGSSEILACVLESAMVRRMSGVIDVALERAAYVVSALRRYLRRGEEDRESRFDLEEEINTILTLLGSQLKHGVALEKRLEPGIKISGDKQGLGQVWINLINNALQAMDYRGILEIESASEKDRIRVSVTDSGPGIPEEIRDRIFQPFFTTKPSGVGVGIGLDICRRIVHAAGGSVAFESRPGRTRFSVYLPKADPVEGT
jgi:PAS domain S-box-containing protein